MAQKDMQTARVV